MRLPPQQHVQRTMLISTHGGVKLLVLGHNSRMAVAAGNWKTVEGEFNAIMAVMLPCRSDRSDSGLAPFAHIADGIIHLIMVRKCSAAQYLRFLASIPRNGVIPEDFPYVDTVDATAVRVQPIGGRLCNRVCRVAGPHISCHQACFKVAAVSVKASAWD